MGTKLLWTGLACLTALGEAFRFPELVIVGAIIMLIGLVLLWLDK
jgi:hypothetical protein